MADPARKTRVLQVVAWNSTRGGAEKHVVDLLRLLPRDEFELGLASSAGGNLESLAREMDVPWFRVPMIRAKPWQAPPAARRAIAAFKPDIVHAHGNRPMLHTVLAGWRSGARLVYTHHGIAVLQVPSRVRRTMQLPIERLAERRVTRHILVDNADLATATRLGLVRRERATVIHNGIAPVPAADGASFRRTHGLEDSHIVVTCVARFDPVKDHPNLLHAWVEVSQREPNARLLLVGGGRNLERPKSLVHELGIAGSVIFTGGLDDVSPAYAASDLLVLPSKHEAMPYVILEAMSAGLPVVATRVGGVAEAVVDGETGLLVPPGAPDALATALLDLLADAPRRQRMGARGRERSSLFSVDAMVASIADVYRQVMR